MSSLSQQQLKKIVIAIGFLIFGVCIAIPKQEALFWNAIAIAFLMIYFWITEVIPIYLTALFPLVLAAPLGFLTNGTSELNPSILARCYGDRMIFTFLGGFMLALALEKWNIHTQIAKGILRMVGTSKTRIILGFLLSTTFLSMWVSNTATALMLLPMALALINSLSHEEQNSKFSRYLLLSIAYGASTGGVGTLIGSPPNLQMASTLEQQFHIEVDFISWFKIGFPVCVLMTAFTYFFFNRSMGKEGKQPLANFSMEKEPWTKNQFRVLLVFLLVVLLWSAKDLIALSGFEYEDENVAILGAFLLFLLPSDQKGMNLLEWSDTKNLPWGILLLFGGGLALAEILKIGGVVKTISTFFSEMNHLPYFVILLILITFAIFVTELISNLALVSMLIPILGAFASESGYSIVQVCFAVTLASSFAFMLPIGTPPNAIVFSAGHIGIRHMAKVGLVMNLVGILVIFGICFLFL